MKEEVLNPYLLLTPGPLSTSRTVREAMMKDWCTWDSEYNNMVQKLRSDLVDLATESGDKFTSVLMQGSGSFSVESVLGSVVPEDGKILVLANGAYGSRMGQIASVLKIKNIVLDFGDSGAIDIDRVETALIENPDITHVGMIHCETTTGRLNSVKPISLLAKRYNKVVILDAMSSFGGIPMDIEEWKIDYLISSANKCIQGVPGFGFIVARISDLERRGGTARSLSLDLYDQWRTMEDSNGKWRFTSPTHVTRAFIQALEELKEEGGVECRYARYVENQHILVEGMISLGFKPLLARDEQSPIITTFLSPDSKKYNFNDFYSRLKEQGFVIYPGKVTNFDCFRIGNIGEVYPADMERLISTIERLKYWDNE